VVLEVGGIAPLVSISMAKGANKTKGDRVAKQHKRGENVQPLIGS